MSSFRGTGTNVVYSQRNVLHPSYGRRVFYESNMSHSEHVIIPKTENTIKCAYWMGTLALPSFNTDLDSDINSELDELDREEFYRLKKVRAYLQHHHGRRLTQRPGFQEEERGKCCLGRRAKEETGRRCRGSGGGR